MGQAGTMRPGTPEARSGRQLHLPLQGGSLPLPRSTSTTVAAARLREQRAPRARPGPTSWRHLQLVLGREGGGRRGPVGVQHTGRCCAFVGQGVGRVVLGNGRWRRPNEQGSSLLPPGGSGSRPICVPCCSRTAGWSIAQHGRENGWEQRSHHQVRPAEALQLHGAYTCVRMTPTPWPLDVGWGRRYRRMPRPGCTRPGRTSVPVSRFSDEGRQRASSSLGAVAAR